MNEDTNSCFPEKIKIIINKIKKCNSICLACNSSLSCIECKPDLYMWYEKGLCINYIPEHYYLNGSILKKCHESCLNCFGPWNNTTTNCMNCISNEYFYRNDTYNCIKIKDYSSSKKVEFKRFEVIYFYIFIIILIVSIILFILLLIFCKIKKNKKEKLDISNKESEKQKLVREQKNKISNDNESENEDDNNSNSGAIN